MGRFFGKLLALTFAVGVATGIVMEFQFGTNWAAYSKFVGDIFGAPLAAEGVFAFFLESGFLGLYLFGRGRVSKGVHWFSILMVAVGATLSAFWIIVANSWQQTPAGYVVRERPRRADRASAAAVFNPSTLPAYFHTVDGGAGRRRLLHGRRRRLAAAQEPRRRSSRSKALQAGAGRSGSSPRSWRSSPSATSTPGRWRARSRRSSPPSRGSTRARRRRRWSSSPCPSPTAAELKATVEIPGLLSWLAFGDVNAPIRGIDEFPPENRPPLWLTFVSFHNMVVLGLLLHRRDGAGACWRLRRGRLWESRRFLRLLVWSIPLPLVACQLGWMAAEVGRQPWIVYGLLRTQRRRVSTGVPAGEILFSLVLFAPVYLAARRAVRCSCWCARCGTARPAAEPARRNRAQEGLTDGPQHHLVPARRRADRRLRHPRRLRPRRRACCTSSPADERERRVVHQRHRPGLGRQRGVAPHRRRRAVRRLPAGLRHASSAASTWP